MFKLKECYGTFIKRSERFAELTRGYSIFTSLAPWFVAIAFACVTTVTKPGFGIYHIKAFLTFIAVICVHLGGNLFDDYIDIKRKIKSGTALQDVWFEHAKEKGRLIINGSYTFGQIKLLMAILFGVAILIGACFTITCGPVIPIIAAITAVLCIFYPASSRFYLSEIIIGLIFGPLLMTGTYIAFCGQYEPKLLVLSIAIGIMAVVLLQSHSLMDYDYDKKVGKKTLCTLTGSKNRSIVLIALEILIAYGIIAYVSLTKYLPPTLLLSVILTLPLSIKLIRSLKEYIDVKDVKFIPKWYFGPMENWEKIKNAHCEYFMYRFYLARNLGIFFCLIIAIVCFLTLKTFLQG